MQLLVEEAAGSSREEVEEAEEAEDGVEGEGEGDSEGGGGEEEDGWRMYHEVSVKGCRRAGQREQKQSLGRSQQSPQRFPRLTSDAHH